MEKENAYMTVEAAFIFPMAAGMILFIICMLLFQYNRCLMEQDLNAMALWGSCAQESEGETLEAMAGKRMKEMYREKYLGWQFTELEIGLERSRFTAKGTAKLAVLISGGFIWGHGGSWETKAAYEYGRLSPVTFIRLCRALEKEKGQNVK